MGTLTLFRVCPIASRSRKTKMAWVLRGLMTEDDEAFVDNEWRFAVAKSCMKRICLHPPVSPSPRNPSATDVGRSITLGVVPVILGGSHNISRDGEMHT